MGGTKTILKRQYNLLMALSRVRVEDMPLIISNLNDEAIEAIYLCIYNSMYNNGILPKYRRKMVNAMEGKKEVLRGIMRAKSTSKKRRGMIQSGGSISLILSTVLPLLTSFLF